MTIMQAVSRSFGNRPTTTIVLLALIIRISHSIILHLLSSFLPPFDASQTLVSSQSHVSPGLRWDAIHFTSIALEGYQWEQQLAFQPLWQAILRLSGECLRYIRGGDAINVEDAVRGGTAVSVIAWTGSSAMLYKLTAHIFPTSSPRFALLTTLLYLLPPTPVPSLPYTEPTYAFFTFTALYLLIAKKQYTLSGTFFAVATGLRATGVLNVLVLAGVVSLDDAPLVSLHPLAVIKRVSFARSWRIAIPCLLAVAPFVLFQWYAYESFCRSSAAEMRSWCESKVPFAYGFVQAEYWNIGLFNYWTPAQLPNILLASPIFLISFLGSRNLLTNLLSISPLHPSSLSSSFSSSSISTASGQSPSAGVHPALLVLYVHHWLMMALLLFASHTQIALRVCITDPVNWWNIASLAMDRVSDPRLKSKPNARSTLPPVPGSEAKRNISAKPDFDPGQSSPAGTSEGVSQGHIADAEAKVEEYARWEVTRIGRWWIGWAVIWGAISTALWAGHYPPA
ncbi:hypothetical protein IAU59_004445 [Kwoniella sp. CBS 9459]